MSTPHQVQVGSLLYTVVDDCTTTYWAIMTGAVTDEIVGDLYAPGFTVDPGRPDLQTKTTVNGLYALTGRPEISFPKLSTMLYPMTLTFHAPGFRDLKVSTSIPMKATFPVLGPSAQLRRLPVRVQGRVVNDLTRAPFPGALVLSVDDPTTPPTVHTTAIRTPLYFDHAPGISAQEVTITPTTAATLQVDSAANSNVITLSTRAGLGSGSIIRLFNAPKTIIEYGVVDHLGPGAPGAGDVFLRNTLNRSYPQGLPTTVQFVNAAAIGGTAALATDANRGDGVLLANLLLNGATLVVDSGALTEEYHEVGAIADADGYYALDGIGRFRELFLHSAQGLLKKTEGWFIEYGHPTNVVDLRLS